MRQHRTCLCMAGRKSPYLPHRGCREIAPGWPHIQSTPEEMSRSSQEDLEEQDLLKSMGSTFLSYLTCKMQLLYLVLLPGDCRTARVMAPDFIEGETEACAGGQAYRFATTQHIGYSKNGACSLHLAVTPHAISLPCPYSVSSLSQEKHHLTVYTQHFPKHLPSPYRSPFQIVRRLNPTL